MSNAYAKTDGPTWEALQEQAAALDDFATPANRMTHREARALSALPPRPAGTSRTDQVLARLRAMDEIDLQGLSACIARDIDAGVDSCAATVVRMWLGNTEAG